MKLNWGHSKALFDLADQIQDLEGTIKEIAIECIEEAQPLLKAAFIDGLKSHERKGDAIDSIDIKPVVVDYNTISGDVGSYLSKNKAGFLHAKAQEYGARSHRGTNWWVSFESDPWKRPAERRMQAKFTLLIQRIMKGRLNK